MKVGEVFSSRFLALSTPKGWLDDWRKTTVVFPEFKVLDATENDGAVAVESRDDIIVRPEKLEHLTPLGADERARFGLKTESVSLAFLRQETDFTAVLSAERTEPRLTARSISFFRVDRDSLQCHYEVNYAIEQSRVQKLLLSLPENTPAALNIVGLDGVKLKEYTGKVVEGRRRWTVLLAEPRRGRVRLAVDFQQRLVAVDGQSEQPGAVVPHKDHALPIVEAEDVSYQSGLVAVEGCAELEVNVKEPPEKSLRRVDVGELAEADYQPGRRLLGAYEYVGCPPEVKIGVTRRPGYDIPPAIVEKCELDTVLSPEGLSRHQAVFHIRSKVSFLRVELPNRAKLWAAELNGSPLKPQRDAKGLLIDLSAGKDGAVKQLKLIYADDKPRPISVRGTLYVPAPKLFLHDSAGTSRVGQAQRGPTDKSDKHGGAALRSTHPTSSDNLSYEVPTADMVWRLHLPSGYQVVSADGTLSTTDVSRPMPAAFKLAGFLYQLSNGFRDMDYSSMACTATNRELYYMEDSGVCYDRQTAESPTCLYSEPNIQFIGRVTGMKDCRWADAQLGTIMGASTPSGRKYSLASGLMELTMNVGARIFLEGQCSFTPDSPDGGYLALGKITIKNSNAAGEYSLRTPTAVVTVEPQAEVGVEVSRGGVTLARTFSGRVRMLSNDNGKEYVMDGHGAAMVIRGDPRSPLPTQISELHVFARSLAEKPKSIELADIVAGGARGRLGGGMGMGGMAGEGTFGSRGGKPDTTRGDIGGAYQPAPPAATVPNPKTPPPAYVQGREKDKKHGETVGMSQPGLYNADLDIEKKEAEKRLDELRSISDMQKESTKYGSPILDSLPYNNGTSVEYPDVEANDKLAGRRDGKHKEAYFALGKLPAKTSLSGMRSLKIDLLQTLGDSGQTITFQGLGVKPRLAVTLADDTRFHKLRFGLAMAVVLIGLAITRRKFRVKTEYVLGVMLATTLGALFGGMEIAQACNWMFFAAAALVPYYLFAGFCRWSYRLCWKACLAIAASFAPKKIGATSVMLGIMLAVSASYAADDAKPQAAKKRVIDLPKDAIILPYDPEWKNGIRDADKLLVPYDKYVELWNRAYPDKKIETKAPPVDFALAGATYSTTLEGEDSLTFAGRIQIDVFTDRYVQVPLGLAGGVLTRAELDGKPARLSVLVTPQPQVKSKAQKPLAAPQQSLERSVVILHITGKGRHTLELEARMKLQRHGGWRAVQGELPTAPAAALDIVVPRPKTELRLDAVADCRRYETEKPDQTIRTALGKNGAIRLRWRPEVAPGRIDRALTASSQAVFDVREDGLGIDWRLTLEFRNAERDRFDVELPDGYLLEKVEGDNVRGWRLRTVNGRPSVEIELLQTAKDREQFSLRLWRSGRIGRGAEPMRFNVPIVSVADAALQSGRLTVRRSPLLELQTIESKGATRIDLTAGKKSSPVAAGPLGIRPFESYSFASVPFTLRLSAVELEAKTSAVVESVLKLAEYKQLFESRVTFDVRGRPLHRLRVLLPEDYELITIDLPCEFYHTVTKQGERPLLTVYPASGLDGETPLLLVGSLKQRLADWPREMPLPRIEALDVGRQSGDVAVQTDPSFDVELLDPASCESVLPGRLHGWLNPKQRELTRLSMHTVEGGYSGKLRLIPRKPDVSCNATTNMRITARTVEETILLNYHVARAGVRRFAFILPESMADSRISAPLMQRKTVTPAGDQFPGMVRVEIELQEEAMDDIRVLVENDRLLGAGVQEAPMPIIVGDVRVGRRYLVLENAGRGELVVDQDKLRGMDPLGSRRKEWAELKSLLGGGITMAYMASPDAERPELSFRVKLHDAVETVKASIGLAETKLVLDAAGAYRAEAVLHVNNETEQYLDVQLPPGASLWTAQVAGEPVKPTLTAVGGDSRRRHGGDKSENRRQESPPTDISRAHNVPDTVRIPLLKTAPGDLDYEVVLRYGGRMPAPSRLGAAEFPMIRCLNITPALCQATLYLPEQYHWFDFGGTMRRVVGETELDVGRIQYQNKQLKQIGLALEKGDKWAKSRAAFNIKRQTASNRRQIGLAVHNYQQTLSMKGTLENPKLQAALSQNASIMQQTQGKLEEQKNAPVGKSGKDNRQKMNDAFASQTINPSSNVAIESGSNFDRPHQTLGRSYNRSSQSVQMSVTPRINIQKEEEERLGVQPPANYDPFASDAPSPEAPQPQGRQTLGRNYDRHRFGYDGPALQRPGDVTNGLDVTDGLASETTFPAYNPRLPGATGGNRLGGRGQQTQQAQEAESLKRYQRRLAKQEQTGKPFYLQGDRADTSGDTGLVPPCEPSDALVQLPTYSGVTVASGVNVAQAPPPAAGLASLDFTLPTRGRAYRFTTPRGEQQITARYVSDDVYRLSWEAAIVGFAIVVILLIVGMIRRGRLDWLVRPLGTWLMLAVGLVSLFSGFLPVASIALIAVACVLKIRWLTIDRSVAREHVV